MTLAFDRRQLLTGMTAMAMTPTVLNAKLRKPFFVRSGNTIGLQLYTLGDEWAKDTDAVFAQLAGIGIKDLELPGLMDKTPRALRAAADRAGVSFSSYHLPAAPIFAPTGLSLLSSPSEIADALGELGATSAVVPLHPLPEGFQFVPGKTGMADLVAALGAAGADYWKRFAAELNVKAQALTAHGITLGYHNHNTDFAPVGKSTGWEILQAETDPGHVFFELDLGWVSAAGRDPATEIRRLGRRVRWLHLKDVKATTKRNFALQMDPSVVGEGRLNWSAILGAAATVGVQHFYIEQEPPFAIPRMEAVQRGHANLTQVR
jgi:sugar phosphate isomerase/epimerase